MSLSDPQWENIIAKTVRENFPLDLMPEDSRYEEQRQKLLLQQATITDFAVDLANRLNRHKSDFDPIKFLDKCSPDVEGYSMSELWEE